MTDSFLLEFRKFNFRQVLQHTLLCNYIRRVQLVLSCNKFKSKKYSRATCSVCKAVSKWWNAMRPTWVRFFGVKPRSVDLASNFPHIFNASSNYTLRAITMGASHSGDKEVGVCDTRNRHSNTWINYVTNISRSIFHA